MLLWPVIPKMVILLQQFYITWAIKLPEVVQVKEAAEG
jgi:hypothetical protein